MALNTLKQNTVTTYLKEIANDDSSFCDSGWFSVSPCSDDGWSDSFFLTRKAPFFLTLFSMSSALSLFRLSWYQLQIKKLISIINNYHALRVWPFYWKIFYSKTCINHLFLIIVLFTYSFSRCAFGCCVEDGRKRKTIPLGRKWTQFVWLNSTCKRIVTKWASEVNLYHWETITEWHSKTIPHDNDISSVITQINDFRKTMS